MGGKFSPPYSFFYSVIVKSDPDSGSVSIITLEIFVAVFGSVLLLLVSVHLLRLEL